jgi:hypothetical protein
MIRLMSSSISSPSGLKKRICGKFGCVDDLWRVPRSARRFRGQTLTHPHWTFATLAYRFELRSVFDDPSIDRRVIDADPAFGHHLFKMSSAQRVGDLRAGTS